MGQIAPTGRHQVGERVFLIERHELRSQIIGRCMQRDGQGHGTGLGEPIHHGHDTRGGDSDATPRQAVGMVIEHEFERGKQLIKVEQRLAHAHEHDIGHRKRQCAVGHVQLTNDLGGAQVSGEPLATRGAETTVHSASCLRRDAQRTAVVFWDEDRLDCISLTGIEQPLAGAIGGEVVAQNRHALDHGIGGQARSEGLGEVGHGLEIGGLALVQPLQQLPGPEWLFTARHHPGLEGLRAEIKKVDWRGGVDGDPPLAATMNSQAGEEKGNFLSGRVGAIGTVDRIGINAVGEIRANRPRLGLLGIRGAHEVAIETDRRGALEDLDHDRARNHKIDKVFKEGAVSVNAVKGLGLLAREVHHLSRDDPQSGLLKP